MKSWSLRFQDGRAVMALQDVAQPAPKAGELLVRVRASSLNRGELIPATPNADAKPVGGEAAGTVEAVGEGVAGFAVGERVMGRAKGAFADCAILDAREAMKIPGTLSFEAAASVPLVFLVAYDMLVTQGGLQKDEWVLVTGVSSGVGVACAQLGRFIGAKVIGTSGSAAKLAKVPLDLAIETRSPGFAARVREATGGKGANLAVNTVGGTLFPDCVASLAYQGRLAIVGYVDGRTTAEVDLDAVHAGRLKIFGVSNKLRTAAERAVLVKEFAKVVLPAFGDGRLVPLIDRVFSMRDLQAAVDYMNSDAQVGKIVVVN